MTAAFAVAAAVAVIAILTLVISMRKAADRLAGEISRAGRLDGQLQGAAEALSAAERRADEDQQALAVAVERADEADRRAAHATGRLAVAGALWDLERLRLEREWAEVTGGPTPLPEPWDGGSRAAVAVDLEIIREVMGTPSELEPTPGPVARDPVLAMGLARVAGEVLRTLARLGEEMTVSFGTDGEVTMATRTMGAGPPPNLSRLEELTAAMGGELIVQSTASGFEARLRLGVGRGPAPTAEADQLLVARQYRDALEPPPPTT